jgi:pseudolysin/vibriolysin
LNEGFSDIAGTVAAFYFEPERATFDIGSHIFKEDGALRYMCDPTRDGRSIDTAARMTPSLDPHYSSGVPNKAFCRAALRFSTAGGVSGEHSQAGVKRASQPFFRANAAYWTTSTTFVQGCQGTLDAARAMGFSPQEIDWLRQSWIDVGVTCGSPSTPPPSGGLRCDETLTSTSGVLTSPNHPSAYGNNFARTYCIAPATGSARLQFTVFDTERNYDFVEILDADGKRVTRTSGTTAPAAYTGTKIGLRFTTDGSVTRPGFRATWASP